MSAFNQNNLNKIYIYIYIYIIIIILPENKEAMLCTKSWLYGFEGILIY